MQLIAAMNPCPCGYHGDTSARCGCGVDQVRRYQSKISGPLLDRLDLHVEVSALQADELTAPRKGTDGSIETSAKVRERVLAGAGASVGSCGRG